MAEQNGFLQPAGLEEVIKEILKYSADLGVSHLRRPAHEQVMIAIMAFFGDAFGSTALSDAAKWASQYADRHKKREVFDSCKKAATDLVAESK